MLDAHRHAGRGRVHDDPQAADLEHVTGRGRLAPGLQDETRGLALDEGGHHRIDRPPPRLSDEHVEPTHAVGPEAAEHVAHVGRAVDDQHAPTGGAVVQRGAPPQRDLRSLWHRPDHRQHEDDGATCQHEGRSAHRSRQPRLAVADR